MNPPAPIPHRGRARFTGRNVRPPTRLVEGADMTYVQPISQLVPPQRIVPISKPNKIKLITKLANGDLRVEQHSGNVFDIPVTHPDFQAFAVYTVLGDGF